MNAMLLPRVRLYLMGAAALVFFGGLLLAVGRWNRAETDRAFVEAAARAVRAPPPPGGVRYWAPVGGADPPALSRVRIQAAEAMRVLPAPVPTAPTVPRSGPMPGEKPPAAPR
jgi:hypothetical protein